MSWTALAVVLLVCVAQGFAQPRGYTGFTEPSRDLTLPLIRPGIVDEVLVEEGDTVEPGQVLVQQDIVAELLEVEYLEAKAELQGAVSIEAAVRELAQKRVDLEKIRRAFDQGVATEMELEHAILDVEIAALPTQASARAALIGRAEADCPVKLICGRASVDAWWDRPGLVRFDIVFENHHRDVTTADVGSVWRDMGLDRDVTHHSEDGVAGGDRHGAVVDWAEFGLSA